MAFSKQRKLERVKHTMELDDNIELHSKGWKVQRVGWIVIFAIMLAGALGVFGEGLASSRKVNMGSAQLEYERFFRYEAEMKLQCSIMRGTNPALISISESYIKHFQVEMIVPEPKETFARAGKVVYVFNGDAPMEITFFLSAEKPGLIEGDVSVNHANYHLSQFIYP